MEGKIMNSISLKGGAKTPSVLFDAENGKIEIKGRSIPENSIEFYRPMIEWLEDYSHNPSEKTEVNIQMEYFNTSSSKCILDILKKLEAIGKDGNQVEINWYYEEDDEDMLEAGEDYQSILRLPFKMIEIVD